MCVCDGLKCLTPREAGWIKTRCNVSLIQSRVLQHVLSPDRQTGKEGEPREFKEAGP